MNKQEIEKATEEQLLERERELREIATENYLRENDFIVLEYLDDNLSLEFERLQFRMGDSPYNPDTDNDKCNMCKKCGETICGNDTKNFLCYEPQ